MRVIANAIDKRGANDEAADDKVCARDRHTGKEAACVAQSRDVKIHS